MVNPILREINNIHKLKTILMKPTLTIPVLAFLILSFTFTSCKKETATDNSVSDSTHIQSDDEVMANNETDQASSDVTAVLENLGGSFALRPDVSNTGYTTAPPAITPPADGHVTVDTANIHKSITITYDGTNSATETRTGKIRLSFDGSFHWKDAGAILTIYYDSVKVTRTADGKTLLIVGNQTITNTHGGLLKDLTSTDSIVHIISGAMYTIFDNGHHSSCYETKKRIYTYNNGLVITTTGTGNGGIAESGIDRYGHPYSCVITQPRVVKQSCDFRLVSGQTVYTSPNTMITTTFGLDADGHYITSCPIGVFYYKLTYYINGVTHTYIGSY
jgi:hypothetical protein